ncbi:hypothetical protein G6F42_026657 [Rhizopus arrhizus]|nr:hypothetical protein G6F42_026657 [Rhizopus arrhizus]
MRNKSQALRNINSLSKLWRNIHPNLDHFSHFPVLLLHIVHYYKHKSNTSQSKKVPQITFSIHTSNTHIAGAKCFVNADLLKAFQQIAVEESSVTKLTISTPYSAYSYKRMLFGVVNGPACFSRCVYLAIEPFLGRFAVNFYDDCVLYAKEKSELLRHLEGFLARMQEVNLKLNANKCEFLKNEIHLLGFVVNVEGVSPLPSSKVEKCNDDPHYICLNHAV